MALNQNEYNALVKKWGYSTNGAIRKAAYALGIGDYDGDPSSPGIDSLHVKYSSARWSGGDIDRVAFGLKKYMVFVHKGVGRGHPINGDISKKIGGSKGRQPKEFMNPILDKTVPKLADDIASIRADLAVSNVGNIKIK